MKRPPEIKQLEELLRSSRLVAGGFMGTDTRPLEDILETDAAEVVGLGYSLEDIAARMSGLTEQARKGLGTTVRLDDKREGSADDNRGQVVCPWPHAGRYTKTLTTIRRIDTLETISWSDICVHFIGAHGFFQGRGSLFRMEPEQLVRILFD